MKITHFSNSFIVVEAAGVRLVCDPWVGTANHGGWHSLPEYPLDALVGQVRDSDIVYISHLHSDHFDPAFLRTADLVGKHFIVKRFDNGVLARRLRELGVTRLTELEAFETLRLDGLTLAIVPQMTSTSAGLEDAVNYDIDTSLVVGDGRHTFFNHVDNPLSLADFARVKAFVDEQFGRIDIACLVAGAAGEYPQCFIGVDREAERQRIVGASLEALRAQLRVLQPRFVFPAGGSYFIPGKFRSLNRYVAQPDHRQFAEAAAPLATPLWLEGGWQVDMAARDPARSLTRQVQAIDRDLEATLAAHASDLYPHEIGPHRAVDLGGAQVSSGTSQPRADAPHGAEAPALDDLLASAQANYRRALAARGISSGVAIRFAVHDDLRFDPELRLAAPPNFGFELAPDDAPRQRRLVIHLDRQALRRCLLRQANWNQTLSGSLCLFDRQPNVHEPATLFSLNFFVA